MSENEVQSKEYLFICYLYESLDQMGNFQQSTEFRVFASSPEKAEEECRRLFPDRKEFHVKQVVDEIRIQQLVTK